MASNTNDSSAKGPCAVCGKVASNRCGQCKTIFYCSPEHQRKDWKQHKKCCFPDGAVCTRCEKEISKDSPSSCCQVPHPEHLQQGTGSMFGASGTEHSFICKACSKSYKKATSDRDCPLSSMPIVTPCAKWCFEGRHTIKPLPDGDERRVCSDVVVVKAGPEMQEQINALDGNEKVRVLKICSEGHFDEERKVELDICLPNLEELQTLDVEMGKIKLTAQTTPKVRKISMQNPSQDDEPDFTIELAELREFTCHYWGPGDYGWLVRMLEVATKLERFDSYKLRVGYLKFCSNHLQSIRLHRAECLERIDVWAPRLTNLDVQAAYDLEEIHFLKDHALKRELPDNFHFDKELCINAVNACLGHQAVNALENHPRVRKAIATEADDW